ncbi:MAG: cupin domain-containing protein [candidate division Zixibacteria bacterium]|nr:cupin domain-containing protein [candidate division Zixibacteria bacterium]
MTQNNAQSGGLENSRPYNLAALLDYVEGSVVSRTIKKGKTGTLTVFSFDRGQELSEHTAPFDAYAYIVDGSARIVIDGNDVNVDAGEIILMPANVPHSLHAEKRFKMLLTMIKEV